MPITFEHCSSRLSADYSRGRNTSQWRHNLSVCDVEITLASCWWVSRGSLISRFISKYSNIFVYLGDTKTAERQCCLWNISFFLKIKNLLQRAQRAAKESDSAYCLNSHFVQIGRRNINFLQFWEGGKKRKMSKLTSVASKLAAKQSFVISLAKTSQSCRLNRFTWSHFTWIPSPIFL